MKQSRPVRSPATPKAPVTSIRKREKAPRNSVVAEALRSSALELFARQNYSSVTIKEISAATGVNASLIYYYFGSKEDLFLDIVETTVEDAFRKFESIKTESETPESIITRWLEIHVTQFVLLRKLAKMSLDYASAHSRSAALDRAIRKFYDKESVVLTRAVQAGIALGVFRPVDAADVTLFISTFLDGVLFRSVMFPKLNQRAVIRHMGEIVLRHLRKN